jgi:hypothetical protein
MTDHERQLAEAEFRGFFFGEGCIILVKYKNKKQPDWDRYWVRLLLSQRVDNMAALQWLADTFGGRVLGFRQDKRAGRWHAQWQLAAKKEVRYLLTVLLAGSLPSVMRQKAEVALQMIDTIKPAGAVGMGRPGYTVEERQLRASLHARFYALSSARKQEAADYQRVA